VLFTATVTVYCENRTKHVWKMLFFVVKPGAADNSQWALNSEFKD